MKGILITTDNALEVRDFGAPLHKTLSEAVDGYIEIVHPMGLASPLVMIVNDEGLLRGLPMNSVGSKLYGMHIHGNPIVGNIVIMKTGWTDDGPDIVGLDEKEITELTASLQEFCTAAANTADHKT